MIEEQIRFLKVISEVTVRTDSNEFAVKLGLTPDQTMGLMKELVKKGFVRKTAGRYLMTGKGKSVLKAFACVLPEKKFVFYKGLDQPTDLAVGSIKDFCDVVKCVEVASLEFHFYRGDFENWVRGAVNDSGFAGELAGIRNLQLKGEELRKAIVKAVVEKYSL